MFYPLQLLVNWLVYDIFNLSNTSHLGVSLNFFLFDSLKILFLLLLINYLMAAIRHYLPIKKLRTFLAAHKFYGFDYLLAAGFGVITPFCSCSSIPLFVGFVGAGIPLGVTLSFLITSPLINEAAVVLFIGLFGWKITLVYVVAGILLGAVGGFILSRLKLEKYISEQVVVDANQKNTGPVEIKKIPWKSLLKIFWREGWKLTKSLTPYILVGVAIGALIHGFVPTGFFEQYISARNPLAVPIAVIVAVPFYANAVGVIPIMQALVDKGIPLGTALAFMMAVVGLSLPEAFILKKVMKTRLLVSFFAVVSLSIIVIGYLFNIFL
ncbi:MAG TPA: permease [Candidatus Saccharimonadales bacterium]|nr:permease [Candidatus Saccharimonadales bacterium]